MSGPRSKRTRGVTLIELMLGLGVTSFLMLGVMGFIAIHTRTTRSNFDRSDMQRGGRTALSVLSRELQDAGLALPRVLAFRRFEADSSSADACDGTPELEIAALDLRREWVIQSATTGAVTLVSPTTPTGADDADLGAGLWLFLYQNPKFDPLGTANGYGLVRVGITRPAGQARISISTTAYSAVQTGLELTQAAFRGTAGGHAPVMMAARVSRFGVDCSDVTRPYLFWERAGQGKDPLVANVDTRPLAADAPAIGAETADVVGLRFRFHVDADGDGRSDPGLDGVLTSEDLVLVPADLSTVTAVEVLLRLRADLPEQGSDPPRYATIDFVEMVATMNINTMSSDYIFIDNTGL